MVSSNFKLHTAQNSSCCHSPPITEEVFQKPTFSNGVKNPIIYMAVNPIKIKLCILHHPHTHLENITYTQLNKESSIHPLHTHNQTFITFVIHKLAIYYKFLFIFFLLYESSEHTLSKYQHTQKKWL